MERNFTRDWKAGDVYAPHDLSAAEARKWKSKKAPTTDAFDVLSLNPLNLYKVSLDEWSWRCNADSQPELLCYVRICYGYGKNKTKIPDWLATCEPETCRKGHPESYCSWSHAQRVSTSRTPEN